MTAAPLLPRFFLVLALALHSSSAWASIYTFIDENGTVHFTNIPASPQQKAEQRGIWRGPIKAGDPRPYEQHIQMAANRYAMDPLLIKAVIKTESNFDCLAVSPKGARGLMQLMPETAADLNIFDPFDPRENILGGTSYLRQMLARFGGDLRLALAAYNAGPARVEAARGLPMISETRDYVARVMHHYQQMTGTAFPSPRWLRAASQIP